MTDRSTATGTTATLGIDHLAVTAWLERAVPNALAPFTFEQIAGGRSNLTYRVTDAAGTRWVLRRPPLGKIVATAHDVVREAGILSRLSGTGVAVPTVVGVCTDLEVNESPFFVMEFLDGEILRNSDAVEAFLPLTERRALGDSLVDTLARLHSLAPAAHGWSQRSTSGGYVERQLSRWSASWEGDRVRVLEDISRTRDALSRRIPPQLRSSVVHGDYRLDNALMGAQGQVLGVLDWELSTVGDPLADLGQFLMYWAQPGDEVTALETPPTFAAGLPTRDELADRYLTATGMPGDDLEYYLAFNWWKTACIVEGVYTRVSRGSMGRTDRTPESFGVQAQRLAAQAWLCAQNLA